MRVNVTDNSSKFIDAKNEAIERALEAIGITAEGHAKLALTGSDAVDTGRLRNSITHSTKGDPASLSYSWKNSTKGRGTKAGSDVTKTKGGEEEGKVYVGTNVEYAPYIEFGTSKMAARPYLKPAIADHNDEYKQI